MIANQHNVDEALSKVRELIEKLVRYEQLRDPLTGLPNDTALSDELDEGIAEGKAFWCALVEVDYFKRINERFGYDSADEALKRIAHHLSNVNDFFPQGAKAFRSHGDEFYIVGTLDGETEDSISGNLERIRASIEGIRLKVDESLEPLNCTVSIGWMLSKNAREEGLRAQDTKLLVQDAVSYAKRRGRNRIVKHTEEMRKYQTHSIRDSCNNCESNFVVDIPLETEKTGSLYCPNCGSTIDRPQIPEKPPGAKKM